MKALSLVMIVKDEERCLGRCLNSAQDIVDEIIVVDTGSKDSTKQIANSFGAKVFDFPWINNFAQARNFALNQALGDWNLVLDADEYIVNTDREQVREFILTQNAIGKIKLVNKFIQDDEEKHSQAFISRLMPRGIYYEGAIHEQLVSTLPRIIAPIEVEHDGYAGTDKGQRNLQLLLLALKQTPSDPYMLYQTATQYFLAKRHDLADQYFQKCYLLISYAEPYRPEMIVKYLYNLIAIGNFEKGLEVLQKEQDALANYPDFHFVSGIFYLELVFKDQRYLHLFPEIEKEYLKCLELGESGNFDGVIGTGSFYALYNLGVLYEVTGDIHRAKNHYAKAAACGYLKATRRLEKLGGI